MSVAELLKIVLVYGRVEGSLEGEREEVIVRCSCSGGTPEHCRCMRVSMISLKGVA